MFLSTACLTHEACFIYTKPALSTACLTHESCFIYTKPALSTLACSYPPNPDPHKKRPYIKGLSPHSPRIAAFIAKTSKAGFIHSLSYPRSLSYPQSLFLSKTRTLPESPLPSQKQAKLVLSTACFIYKACFYPLSLVLSTKACFYPQPVLPTKPVLSTQSPFLSKTWSSPESPLLSQKQAKLVLSTKSRFYPPKPVLSTTLPYFYPKPGPHQKRPYTKGLLPHSPRIAASIAKISKACFIHNSALFLSKARSSPKTPLHKRASPAPSQNRRFHRKNKQSWFYPQPVLSTQSPFLSKTWSSPESPLLS